MMWWSVFTTPGRCKLPYQHFSSYINKKKNIGIRGNIHCHRCDLYHYSHFCFSCEHLRCTCQISDISFICMCFFLRCSGLNSPHPHVVSRACELTAHILWSSSPTLPGWRSHRSGSRRWWKQSRTRGIQRYLTRTSRTVYQMWDSRLAAPEWEHNFCVAINMLPHVEIFYFFTLPLQRYQLCT